MIESSLEHSFDFVSKYRRINPNGGFNKFDFEYKTPSVNGLSKYQSDKDLHSVKPSTLEYIIFNLQNADIQMIVDATTAYLYYWKIRKADNKKMREEYKKILVHYTMKNNAEVPFVNIQYEVTVYSISFNIGSIKVNKFGYTTDKERYKKLISDAKNKYENVSIGNLIVHQEIQFKTSEQAKLFEKEAIINLRLHPNFVKCKNCFDGYKEAYLSLL